VVQGFDGSRERYCNVLKSDTGTENGGRNVSVPKKLSSLSTLNKSIAELWCCCGLHDMS